MSGHAVFRDAAYRQAAMRQAFAFAAVGAAAMSTHLLVAAALVEGMGVRVLPANAVAFFVAFAVSVTGHARWTFPVGRDNLHAARLRFFAVAVFGFFLNQSLYAEALRLSGGRFYLVILAVVLIAVAALTFTLSKLWAFAEAK